MSSSIIIRLPFFQILCSPAHLLSIEDSSTINILMGPLRPNGLCPLQIDKKGCMVNQIVNKTNLMVESN